MKRATGKPTRDYERERDVILGVRAMATERGVSPALAEQLLRLLIRSSLTTQEQAERGRARHRQRAARAGHRRRRQDGQLVRELPGLAGLRGRGRRHRHGARGRAPRGGLAQHRPQARLHRAGHAARGDRCDPARPGAAPPDRGDLRCRLAEVAAARGAHGAEVPRLQGHLRAPDVRAGHRAAVRPPRGVRRPGACRGAGGRARAVRARPWSSRWS